MKTDPPSSDIMFSRVRLEEIQLLLGQLQNSSSQVGLGLQETRVNTQRLRLMPLLALLEEPDPDATSLARNLERTLASIRDRLAGIEQTLLPCAHLAAQLATVQTTLVTASSNLKRLEGAATSLDSRMAKLEAHVAALFEDGDSPVT